MDCKMATGFTPSTPMTAPPLHRYQTAIAQITTAIAQSPPDATLLPPILEALVARDAIHTQLQTPNSLNGETLTAIAQLDQQLKAQAATIDRYLQTIDWQTSFSPPETAWWWQLKNPKRNAWWNQDWLWQALSITCITVSVGLFGDISTRFLKGGPDALGAIAVSAQSIGTLLTASSTLTIAGHAANKRLLTRLHLREQYWPIVGAGGSVLLLASAIGLRQSLPQIATRYSDWGFNQYKQGHLSAAEEPYKRALQLNPDDNQTHFRLGLLYEDLQDLEKARASYQIAASAGIETAINNLSRLYLRDKKPAAATLLLRKTLEKSDQLVPETHYVLLKNLGWARFQQGSYSEAEEKLQAAIKLKDTVHLTQTNANPNSEKNFPIASPYCLLAQVKTAQGHKAAALIDWETCNAEANPYIPEEDEWAITARKLLKANDEQLENVKKPAK
jgi:tetratricopeptide (TPR) repeat protein